MSHDGILGLLCDIQNLEPIPIESPNETETMATKSASVFLNPMLKLHHVLFVPGLNCNLISMAQLIEEHFFDITFTKKLRMI